MDKNNNNKSVTYRTKIIITSLLQVVDRLAASYELHPGLM